VAAPASSGLPFGLRRNHLLGIGAVLALLIGVMVFQPFGGGDEEEEDAAAVAGKKGKGKGKGRGKADARAARGSRGVCQLVQCTDEQKAAIKPLLQGYQQAVAADEKSLREVYAKLAAAFTEEDFDDAALDEAYATVGGHQEAIDREARKTLAAVHEVLTTEQRETIAKQVAREGPASIFERGGRGDRPRRPDRRRGKPAAEGGARAGARALQQMGGKFQPAQGERDMDRENEPREEEEEPEEDNEPARRAAPI
jgi:Spy/CpxP family protein refolding chaperone